MKFLYTLLVFCMAYAAGAQLQFFHAFPQEKSLKEIHIRIPPQGIHNYGYYNTPVYNDMFTMREYADQYVLPALDYYKEKKVARVTITDNAGAARFILDISRDGHKAKTTLFTELLREDEYFYDETGRNIMTVKSYSRNNIVLRLDTIRYDHQKKIINDTVYTYTTVRQSIYKSGSFLNEQNKYYNDTYAGIRLEHYSPFDLPEVYYEKGKAKAKGRESTGTLYVRERFPVNYTADRFYFSREQTDVEDYTFTFRQQPVNPGGEALLRYVPELPERNKPKYGDLACERFDEPRFTRQAMYCGTGLHEAKLYNQSQAMMIRHYTFSQNSNGLQDTCYSTRGNEQSPQYFFLYAYFE